MKSRGSQSSHLLPFTFCNTLGSRRNDGAIPCLLHFQFFCFFFFFLFFLPPPKSKAKASARTKSVWFFIFESFLIVLGFLARSGFYEGLFPFWTLIHPFPFSYASHWLFYLDTMSCWVLRQPRKCIVSFLKNILKKYCLIFEMYYQKYCLVFVRQPIFYV